MRKISIAIAEAFEAGTSLKMNNTHTDGKHVWLFGNMIAKKENGKVLVSYAGWSTQTTMDRLRAILDVYGYNSLILDSNIPTLYKKDGVVYLQGFAIKDPMSFVAI